MLLMLQIYRIAYVFISLLCCWYHWSIMLLLLLICCIVLLIHHVVGANANLSRYWSSCWFIVSLVLQVHRIVLLINGPSHCYMPMVTKYPPSTFTTSSVVVS